MPGAQPTEGADYTERLVGLEPRGWKRLVDDRVFRWNVRRLFGDRLVLDLGCGIGRNLAHLAPGSVGVDHNLHSVEMCRQSALVAFGTEEFPRTEYARPGRFGGLLAAHLVEHMSLGEAQCVLGNYISYLAPGAVVVLICPQERGYRSDATHMNFTDFESLAELVNRVGLSEDRCFSFPFPRAAGRVFTYNEFVMVARKP